jgi:putative nucleotidyltransferase-like protein
MEYARDHALTRSLASAIAGSGPARPDGDAREWLDHALRHRVHLLLADRIGANGRGSGWPPAIAAELSKLLGAAVLVDAVRHDECVGVFSALHARGIRAVVFKGGALAHTVYRVPYLRPRVDTDVLILKADLPAVERVFAARGYSRPIETSGALITQQCHFERLDRSGVVHAWDVHWKIVNVQAAADALTYEEICRDGVALPAIGSAVAPSTLAAMLLACLHRVAHHADAPDLLWLMDIHLLAGRLSEDEWRRLVALARERGVWAACARSLSRTRTVFDTLVPPFVAEALDAPGDDPSARLLDPGLRQIDLVRADLAALATWSARLRLVRQHVFPPAAFMMARYGVRRRAALPWWYIVRLWSGVPKWFRRLKP